MTASFWLDNFLSQKCHFSFKLYLNKMFLIPTHYCLYASAFFQFTTKCDLKHLGVALSNMHIYLCNAFVCYLVTKQLGGDIKFG